MWPANGRVGVVRGGALWCEVPLRGCWCGPLPAPCFISPTSFLFNVKDTDTFWALARACWFLRAVVALLVVVAAAAADNNQRHEIPASCCLRFGLDLSNMWPKPCQTIFTIEVKAVAGAAASSSVMCVCVCICY